MFVADIGAGEGYYTVRLARVVGASGRVLAEASLTEAPPRILQAMCEGYWTVFTQLLRARK